MRTTLLAMALSAAGAPALAVPPVVATDLPPVHSLVAQVMEGLGSPELILPPGASPHGYAMRPSEAAALDEAGLVVWMGAGLTPWLARAIETLAGDAQSLPLLEVEGTALLGYREGPVFDHHAGEAAGNAREPEHRGAPADAGDHDHDHAGPDPHAWLDPSNAKLWLGAIAGALAGLDPENAAAYRANAAAAQAEIDALTAVIADGLAPVQDVPFVVFHDAYRYFGHRFGTEAAGAIALADGTAPGPARISDIRDLIARTGAACVFAEPQFPTDLIATVTEGTGARVATLDPLGTALEPGPEFYAGLLRSLADGLRACLDPAA